MPEGFAMLRSRRQKIKALVFGADSFLVFCPIIPNSSFLIPNSE